MPEGRCKTSELQKVHSATWSSGILYFQKRSDSVRSSKKNTFDFDENFEVTYEEEVPFHYKLEPESPKKKSQKSSLDIVNLDTDPMRSSSRAAANARRHRSYEDDGLYEENDYEPDYDDEGMYEDYSRRHSSRRRYDDEDEYDDLPPRSRASYHERYPDSGRSPGRKKRNSQTPLAAPIQKGGKAVYRFSQTVLRNLSLLLILAIIVLLIYNFWRGSAPYGDIEHAVSSQNYTLLLAAYFAVAAFFILFELFSALWAMTRVRVWDEYGTYKEDVGRGLFSFLFIYICSYGAFLTNKWIPEMHDILKGAKGALDVFGSMHNILFGICAAGVISCLLRKYSLSL